jgi:hypothetical protein
MAVLMHLTAHTESWVSSDFAILLPNISMILYLWKIYQYELRYPYTIVNPFFFNKGNVYETLNSVNLCVRHL